MRAVVSRIAVAALIASLWAPGIALAGTPSIVRPVDAARLTPLQLGEQLYAGNCLRCHGIGGRGNTADVPSGEVGPPLRGAGALAADFYLRTGYMPLEDAHDQPIRSPAAFDAGERTAIVRYIASLGGGPSVPRPGHGDVAEGRELFTDHCAGCHQVAAEGGILTGAKAPPLDRADATEIAEAVRIGPYVMPKFSASDLSDAELDSIIAYVQYAKDPQDAGGWGISHLGPFPEGMVTWFLAMLVLVATCVAIGKRGARR
jgi:ubiquinol-cytochrome c reductase cytochrome c subunit